MTQTTNAKSHEHTTRKAPFKANNLFGEQCDNGYVVYSYGYHFPLYAFIGGEWFKNSSKYSVTTSKQQTQSRPDLSWSGNQSEFVEVNTEKLKHIIKYGR